MRGVRRILPSLLAAALAVLPPSPPAWAEDPPADSYTLLSNGTLRTMAGETIPGGSVLLRGARIAAVGRDVAAPPGAKVIDCTGRLVVPGFIDAGTQVGMVDLEMEKSVNDTDEGLQPSTPDLDARDGLNIESLVFAVTRSHGVTTVLVHPQATNVINGLGALLHATDHESIDARTVRAPTGLHVSFGVPPKERFGEKNQSPSTRMGIAAVLRREFARAREYDAKKARAAEKAAAGGEGGEPPPVDRGLEALARALRGEIPVFARAERLDDIRTALRLGEELGLRIVLFGASDAWKIAPELARRGVPVIYGPVLKQPDSTETLGARMDAPRILHEARVNFCLMTGDSFNSRNLPYHAGIAASWGLPEEAALAAITRDAARILGLQDTLGTLEVGREATLSVFDGSPLEPLSRVEHMFIRGKEVPLRSFQDDLHDRWKDR